MYKRIDNKDDRRVIPNDFYLLPSSGHAGTKRMTNNIIKYFYWPALEKDVKEFVKRSEKCQKQKHSLPMKEPMIVITTANTAFEKVYLDLVKKLKKNAYNTTVHSETKFTPYELVFGKVCPLPSNILKTVEPLYNFGSYPCELKYRLQLSQKQARDNLLLSKRNRKTMYDKYLNPVT